VTGRQLDENHLNAIGEKVFNLQRAILVQEGRMGKKYDTLPDHSFTVPLKLDMTNPDCLVPAAGDSANSLKGAVVDREAFETAMEEYYSLRGWDPDSGLQTARGLKALGLADIVGELKLSGCLADDTLVRPQRRP
jgi:aldehyde:ferredoxin oxidoreductase